MKAVLTFPLTVAAVGSAASLGKNSRQLVVEDTALPQALAQRWEAQDRLAQNKALVRRLIETANSGGSIDEFFAPEVPHRQNGRTVVQDADARRQASQRRRGSWEGLRREIKQLIAEGDLVAAHVTFHGRHLGEYRGIPATGHDVSYDGVHLYRIANGRVVESSLVTEDFWLIEQLGGVVRPRTSQNLASEEAAIRQALAERWEAQASADVAAFSQYFAEDADFVNVVGRRWRGRAEVAKELGAFTQANVRVEGWSQSIETIRFLRPDVAIVHARWQTPSRRSPSGRELGPSQGITTQVFVKEGGRWYVSALHNTLTPSQQE